MKKDELCRRMQIEKNEKDFQECLCKVTRFFVTQFLQNILDTFAETDFLVVSPNKMEFSISSKLSYNRHPRISILSRKETFCQLTNPIYMSPSLKYFFYLHPSCEDFCRWLYRGERCFPKRAKIFRLTPPTWILYKQHGLMLFP